MRGRNVLQPRGKLPLRKLTCMLLAHSIDSSLRWERRRAAAGYNRYKRSRLLTLCVCVLGREVWEESEELECSVSQRSCRIHVPEVTLTANRELRERKQALSKSMSHFLSSCKHDSGHCRHPLEALRRKGAFNLGGAPGGTSSLLPVTCPDMLSAWPLSTCFQLRHPSCPICMHDLRGRPECLKSSAKTGENKGHSEPVSLGTQILLSSLLEIYIF